MGITSHTSSDTGNALDAPNTDAAGERSPRGHAEGAMRSPSDTPAVASRHVMQAVFADIYRNNMWGGANSVSGPGSELAQTDKIIQELPALFRTFNIRSVLDIPCGDFHWMRWVDLAGVDYIGADIVPEIMDRNRKYRTMRKVRFELMDLIHDPLPSVDLILCRDCLVHFDLAAITRSLENIRASGSRYLLTTTFTGDRLNDDIVTGQWRPLDLESPPFGLPQPLQIIQEECQEKGGVYADKALALWRVADLNRAVPELDQNDLDKPALLNASCIAKPDF